MFLFYLFLGIVLSILNMEFMDFNYLCSLSFDLTIILISEIIINTIDDDLSLTQIFITSHTMFMWWRWLVDWPVVVWWVDDWVFELNIIVSLMMFVVFLVLMQVKWNLLVSCKMSVESWHSCCFNFIFTINIKMLPGLIEIVV